MGVTAQEAAISAMVNARESYMRWPMPRRGHFSRAVDSRIRFRYLAEDGRWFNDPEVAEYDGQDCALTV
jgi:hypothetical protein